MTCKEYVSEYMRTIFTKRLHDVLGLRTYNQKPTDSATKLFVGFFTFIQ